MCQTNILTTNDVVHSAYASSLESKFIQIFYVRVHCISGDCSKASRFSAMNRQTALKAVIQYSSIVVDCRLFLRWIPRVESVAW